ncbi:uncharacterized protein MELLADRAFT_90140 [Melampsora larici-populina 98AG31]|uniref:Uncharacterized protein n=1 Tax=Melampsora larici-populina (strain 98AG31 / pathotype 3-4-7) TaxID=747676 RepID=F4RVU3_MELLP|nr:uncharacterized protein MELLADRAFT_90140 [Melampsora larici-populina 98AG31]EGG03418.1 hypothetical protein MELLADRAFT_90140 [Melampsora larici-populina 98AG31]
MMLHIQAFPIPDYNPPFKLNRRMETMGLERSAQTAAEFAHNPTAAHDAFRSTTIESPFHSSSPYEYVPEQFPAGRRDEFSPHTAVDSDFRFERPKPIPDRKASTASTVGRPGVLRNLASKLEKTANALDHKPLSIRIYEGTGMKAFVKFLGLTGRAMKSAGKRAGSLAVKGVKKTGTAVKITAQYTLGFTVAGGLAVYDGIVGLVKWTGRLAAYAAVGTYKGAKRITQLLALGIKTTGKGAKTAVGAAAKGAKSAAVVTTKGTKSAARATLRGGKIAAKFTARGGRRAAKLIDRGTNNAKFRIANTIARSGERVNRLGMDIIEKAIARSEETGEPIKLPQWILLRQKNKQPSIPGIKRKQSFKLAPARSPTWPRTAHSGPL